VGSEIANPFAASSASLYELPEAWLDDLQTPALVVYLDRVRENVQRMIAYSGSPDRWRPHLKTTKIPEVWSELLAAGVRHFKCATTREAALFVAKANAQQEQADLLIAYPLAGPGLRRLGTIAAQAKTTKLSLLVESHEVLEKLPPEIGVFVDVNPGMNRTGMPLGNTEAIVSLARAAGVRFRGLHFYDGHLHDLDLGARREAIFAGYERLLKLCARFDDERIPVAEVITAGTPAFRHALDFEGFRGHERFVHRISPGTVVFHDGRSQIENPDVELVPAALVLSRVISHPSPGVATCDAGSKSIAAEAGDPCAFVLGSEELIAMSPSEEHLPMRSMSGSLPERGESLLLVPRHVCPTVNLAEEAVLVESGQDPRIVHVAARAHELRHF
jgi:D-serine deaminase-like pyridoxal phosphate-dependent protein